MKKHIKLDPDAEPQVKAYKHKPYIVPAGKTVCECDLITGRVRVAEWQDIAPKQKRPSIIARSMIALRLKKPPKPHVPIMQLVEYDDCIYIPVQTLPTKEEIIKLAKRTFDRIGRIAR